jgi:hypothetical protein
MKKIKLGEVIKISLLRNCICCRINFKGDWFIFLDKWGDPFDNISLAISYFRENDEYYKKLYNAYYFELSEFEQARMGESNWDNA